MLEQTDFEVSVVEGIGIGFLTHLKNFVEHVGGGSYR
jgi:hypothetical protein